MLFRSEKNAVKYINEIKKMMPLLLIFYFRSGALLYEYEFSSDKPKLDRVAGKNFARDGITLSRSPLLAPGGPRGCPWRLSTFPRSPAGLSA